MMTQRQADRWLVERLPGARPLRLLDVGCAECLEAEALLAAEPITGEPGRRSSS
jgi:hypothetical protein